MRAIVFHEHGGPEVLRLEPEWPRPEPREHETLVEVKACALNHLDVFVRRGMPGVQTDLPHISGGDIAGVDTETGQRVLVDPLVPEGAIGENTQGGLAQYVAAPRANLIPLPDDVELEDAAALPIAYGTAWKMLVDRGAVREGESVLVIGASGGVGTAAVQIAKLRGAEVYAASSDDVKRSLLSQLGADHVVDTSAADWGKALWQATGKQGVDVVVDYSGQATWPTSIRSLKHGGRLLTCGATSGYEAVTDLRYVWTREQTIMGSDGWTRDGLETLLDLVRQGRIRPVIDRVLALTKAAEAHEAIEQRKVFGKVILTP
ncbi:MAG: zinc-binding dehydrogenase [Actinomycetota bacterium]|nr:zinc-binding dehydrogenase [Actinomycetota bacterium]